LTLEHNDVDVREAVIEYLRQESLCYVPERDFIGQAIARNHGYKPTSLGHAPDVLGYFAGGGGGYVPPDYDPFADEALLDYMVQRSEADVCMFDACELAIAYRLERQQALPWPLAEFVQARRQRPNKPGRYGPGNEAHNRKICGAINLAARLGNLYPTRGRAKEGGSACDLVVECLRDACHAFTTYEALEKIWQKRQDAQTG
jgi:hypothetical protein